METVDKTKCETRLEKIDENSLMKLWFLHDKTGKEVIVATEMWGLPKAERELEGLLVKKDITQNYDKVKELAKVNAEIAAVEEIKQELIAQAPK